MNAMCMNDLMHISMKKRQEKELNTLRTIGDE